MPSRGSRALASLALAAAAGVAACAPKQPPLGVASDPTVAETAFAPVVAIGDGTVAPLATRVCRPPRGDGLAPLAIINHGAPSRVEETRLMQPTGCDSEPAQWFTSRGYVVVFALRRGFGGSGGAIAEESGTCEAPDYVHAGSEGARDIDAVVRWAERLPGVRADATVVVGQSTGGWASLAYAARPDARAVAVINMAGGRGGRAFGASGTYCHPERLIAASAAFGAVSRVPTLWIYSANDSYFTPDLATKMAAAFTTAGGVVSFVAAGPFGQEGHNLFYGRGGSAVWGPYVARFLAPRPGGATPGA